MIRELLTLQTEEGAMNQGLWGSPEWRKGKEVNCPLEPTERNAALLTPALAP